jgi:hypothetical protein
MRLLIGKCPTIDGERSRSAASIGFYPTESVLSALQSEWNRFRWMISNEITHFASESGIWLDKIQCAVFKKASSLTDSVGAFMFG